ncbi:MAG: hypothetical protein ACT4NY_33145, partial [Pseudonocardiales bacterium]
SYARPRIGQVLPAPDQARCEPSQGSQVKPGGALVHSPLVTKRSKGQPVQVRNDERVVLAEWMRFEVKRQLRKELAVFRVPRRPTDDCQNVGLGVVVLGWGKVSNRYRAHLVSLV